ncbi:MAG: xanthine dehydrogenase family protein subunit M [Planctomycetes bacterium]|nr:xanthine dehydrogenase family protein subunit M [Planctomycetota bacterium]MBI3844062.1 xanthine dehydrogenase family protein subunit M [Planctomycetota bacterium]
MKAFELVLPTGLDQATAALGTTWGKSAILAGGIDILGEMKERTLELDRVVNLKSLRDLRYVTADAKGLKLGALATLTEIANSPDVKARWPGLAQAAHSVGTPQIRNVATIGGNLCQRPRCWYYRGLEFHCLKKGGDHCFAEEGENRYHAIFGDGPCHIVHPSDCAPALIALGARMTITGADGKKRDVDVESFFTMPDEVVERENVLHPNDVVTEITVPAPAAGAKSLYLKMREKQSFDFALASVAIAGRVDGGKWSDVRVVLGGVAPKPWRSKAAEDALNGKRIEDATARAAGEAAVKAAKPMRDNAYKVQLARVAVARAAMSLV